MLALMRRLSALWLALALLAAPAAARGEERVVVRPEPGASLTRARTVIDGELVNRIGSLQVVRVPDGTTAAALRALERDPSVRWAEADAWFRGAAADPFFNYGVPKVNAPTLWA